MMKKLGIFSLAIFLFFACKSTGRKKPSADSATSDAALNMAAQRYLEETAGSANVSPVLDQIALSLVEGEITAEDMRNVNPESSQLIGLALVENAAITEAMLVLASGDALKQPEQGLALSGDLPN